MCVCIYIHTYIYEEKNFQLPYQSKFAFGVYILESPLE